MMRSRAARVALAVAVLAVLAGSGGCGGSLKESKVGGVASYERGKGEFDRGDYLDAIEDLKAYVEQFPGTEKTDDALFYLGESYFKTKDYTLAAGQFDRLIRDFPQSSFHPDALFELAQCDDLQSRPAPLDQAETTRAISRYKDFLELYPENLRAAEARRRVDALNDRLAEKRWRNGRLYYRLKHDDAASVYFRSVIQDYPSSRWAGESRLLLAEVLVRQGRPTEAADTLREVASGGGTVDIKRRAEARLRQIEGGRSSR
jgi:outer membrane protein assembly factor BamD